MDGISNVTFFGSKEVSWTPLLVMSRFCTKGGGLDLTVGDVTFLHQNVPDRTESWPDDSNLGRLWPSIINMYFLIAMYFCFVQATCS